MINESKHPDLVKKHIQNIVQGRVSANLSIEFSMICETALKQNLYKAAQIAVISLSDE